MLINHTAEDCRRLPTTRHLHLINQYAGMFAITEFAFFLLPSFKKAKKESVFFHFSSADGMPDGPASLSDSTFPPRHGCDDDPFAPFTRERLFFSPFFFFPHVGEIGGGLQEVAVTVLRSW